MDDKTNKKINSTVAQILTNTEMFISNNRFYLPDNSSRMIDLCTLCQCHLENELVSYEHIKSLVKTMVDFEMQPLSQPKPSMIEHAMALQTPN